MDALENRSGLPDALRVLADALPREGWESHPNFSALTRFWLDRHLMFRDVLGRLQAGTQGRIGGAIDPRRHVQETSHYAGFLLNQLHGHHQIEDMHYFPQLQGLDGRLERGFALLDADHHALDGHIRTLAETTNAYLRGPEGKVGVEAANRLHDALARFDVFLDRHLEDEEDLVVPVILTYAPDLH